MNDIGPGPRFSRAWWSAQVPLPTVRLGFAIAGVAAVVLVLPAAWWLLGFVGLAAAVDSVLVVRPWRVSVNRVIEPILVLNQPSTITWRLHQPGTRSLHVRLADSLPDSLGLKHPTLAVDVPAEDALVVASGVMPSRRGTILLPSVTVRTYGPLGLAARQHRRSLPDTIEVHPVFRSRAQAELRIRRGRILESGLRSARALGRGTEFDSLRDYTRDDEYRRIDWAATARRGRPIVRTHRTDRNQVVLNLLDTGRLMAGVVDGVPRLDHAMDAVMALTTVATRLGDRTGLIAFSSRVRAFVPARADRGQLRRMTQSLYRLEPDLVESAFDVAFAEAVARQQRRALLVVHTELSSEALVQGMLPALPLLLRRHEVIVVSTRDSELDGWRTAATRSSDDAYRAAGAVRVLDIRRRTADLLRRRGVRVVDEPAETMAARLADAYLDLKSRNVL